MEFSRQGYWSGLPFPSPGDLPNPRIETGSPALQPDALPPGPPGKPHARYLEKGRRARRTARPAGHRPDFDHHRVPARGIRPWRPVTHGGPQCAGRPPPGGPRRRQSTTPTSPTTSHTRTAASRDPVLSPQPPGPLPAPASQTPPRAEGRGSYGKRGATLAGTRQR